MKRRGVKKIIEKRSAIFTLGNRGVAPWTVELSISPTAIPIVGLMPFPSEYIAIGSFMRQSWDSTNFRSWGLLINTLTLLVWVDVEIEWGSSEKLCDGLSRFRDDARTNFAPQKWESVLFCQPLLPFSFLCRPSTRRGEFAKAPHISTPLVCLIFGCREGWNRVWPPGGGNSSTKNSDDSYQLSILTWVARKSYTVTVARNTTAVSGDREGLVRYKQSVESSTMVSGIIPLESVFSSRLDVRFGWHELAHIPLIKQNICSVAEVAY